MGDELLIDVQGVSKRFCRSLRRSLRYATTDLFRELVTGRRPDPELRPGEFWAVKDVSVQLRRGEALGLVGRNGAGKTTLLRMIAGLIRPDAGAVRTRGRVVPLLALGAGFNPVLSGRENIAVNMSILGVPRAEIRKRMDEVIAFAELPADALEAPVRTYSSGMSARLGFACAIHTDPDVLLIDEVLAVGDMWFRTKCYRRLAELRKGGTAFILVSHNAQSILSLCEMAVYLSSGECRAIGATTDVMDRYEVDEESAVRTTAELQTSQTRGVYGFRIDQVRVLGSDDEPDIPRTGRPASVLLSCTADRPFDDIVVGLAVEPVVTGDDRVLQFYSKLDRVRLDIPAGVCEIRLVLESLGLLPGLYSIKIGVVEEGRGHLDMIEPVRFAVEAGDLPISYLRWSKYYQPRRWSVAANGATRARTE